MIHFLVTSIIAATLVTVIYTVIKFRLYNRFVRNRKSAQSIKSETINFVTPELAIDFCKQLHLCLLPKGIYPALTGGSLYKVGPRKDIDVVLYRNRQKLARFETIDLKEQLAKIGVEIIASYGFVTKAKWNGISIDLFNPETETEDREY